MSKIFFYASYSMSFCEGVIYINAPKILMANEAPTQKSTDIFLTHMVKTRTDTLGSASRFIKTYALQKRPTLASALSHQTLWPLSHSLFCALELGPGLWIELRYSSLGLPGIQGHSKEKRISYHVAAGGRVQMCHLTRSEARWSSVRNHASAAARWSPSLLNMRALRASVCRNARPINTAQAVRSCSWLIHLPLFTHPSALKTTTQIQPIPSHQRPLTCCSWQEMIWTESLCWLFWTRAHRSLGRRRGAKIPRGAAWSCWGSAGHPPAQPGQGMQN